MEDCSGSSLGSSRGDEKAVPVAVRQQLLLEFVVVVHDQCRGHCMLGVKRIGAPDGRHRGIGRSVGR